MAEYTWDVIESQVDWLTVSAHGRDAARNMLDYANSLAKGEQAKGNRKRRWRLMGYEGTHVGAIEYGARDAESAILRLIGDTANRHLEDALSLADQVTRIDLAATARADPPDPDYGCNAYTMAEGFHARNPRGARPWFVGDADGGYTCYVGDRQSENFLRIYNKGAEALAMDDQEGAERYRACWRVELEAKASMARTLADWAASAEDRPAVVLRYLDAYCQAHGIAPPFVVDRPMALLPGFRRRADAESRIRHLARNVKPTLDWLREAGELDRALSALGLA